MSKVSIEVAYARPDVQHIFTVEVEEGSSIEQVILISGILEIFPEIDLRVQRVGIFGKLRELSDIVQDGDRVEVYRPLVIDPKEARRSKAKLRKKK